MKIAVLGTGSVGQALAGRLLELGHDVVVGTRDPEATRSRSESFVAWHDAHRDAGLATFAEAAAAAELVVNATSGPGALPALESAGADQLAGKVVIDISNPLDFSAGFPPTLFVKDTDSLAEQIQRTFPQARVVKTLNTLTAALMVNPADLGADSSVFVSGNDDGGQGHRHRAAPELRSHRRHRPRRHHDRTRPGDAAPRLAAADGRPRYAHLQLQDRPLTGRLSVPGGCLPVWASVGAPRG